MTQHNRAGRIENLILALWVGSMIAIGYIAAPVLFSALDDRALAGALAGRMFAIVGIVGLVAGGILLLAFLIREGSGSLSHWRFWALLIMMMIVLGSQFVLQPMMADLKAQGIVAGSEIAKRFGMLHGVSSILYLVTSVIGVVLILFGTRPSGPRLKTLAELKQL